MSRMWLLVPVVSRVVVGAALLLAAALKAFQLRPMAHGSLVGPQVFAEAIARHGLFPDKWALGLAYVVISVETLIGIWLITQVRPRLASVAAVGLLLSFSAYLLVLVAQGKTTSCACFRSFGEGESLRVSLGRALMLSAAALVGTAGAPRGGT